MTTLLPLAVKQCRWYYSAIIGGNNADWELTDKVQTQVLFNTGTDKNTIECPGRMIRLVHVAQDCNQRAGTVAGISGTGHGYVQVGPGLFDGYLESGCVVTFDNLTVRFFNDGQEDLYEVSGVVRSFE